MGQMTGHGGKLIIGGKEIPIKSWSAKVELKPETWRQRLLRRAANWRKPRES
jgi:hypothetical protein